MSDHAAEEPGQAQREYEVGRMNQRLHDDNGSRAPRTATGRKVVAIYGDSLLDDVLGIEAEASEPVAGLHTPDLAHQYDIVCTVCGQRGTLRIAVDPQDV